MSRFTNKSFFEQTRADGSKYFYASVQKKGRWLFGLLPCTTTYWVHVRSADLPYLFRDEEYAKGFDTLRAASSALNKAIHREEQRIAHEEVIGFRKVSSEAE